MSEDLRCEIMTNKRDKKNEKIWMILNNFEENFKISKSLNSLHSNFQLFFQKILDIFESNLKQFKNFLWAVKQGSKWYSTIVENSKF